VIFNKNREIKSTSKLMFNTEKPLEDYVDLLQIVMENWVLNSNNSHDFLVNLIDFEDKLV